jgi:dolichol kinase
MGYQGTALHEIIHLIWFFVWNNHFNDNNYDYETPHLKWIFSEMVVDPIMRHDERLYSINPYFESGCTYEYFYTMEIEGTPILDTMLRLYESNTIITFMEKGYKYCLEHETEIRKQMN